MSSIDGDSELGSSHGLFCRNGAEVKVEAVGGRIESSDCVGGGRVSPWEVEV